MSKRNIVLDTSVLKFAEKAIIQAGRAGVKEFQAAQLIFKILEVCHRIVLDPEKQILKEYEANLDGNNPFIVKIWQFLTTQEPPGKIVWRSCLPIQIPGFDSADHKFIQVAANMPEGVFVISGEADFFGEEVLEFAKKKGIIIKSIEEAIDIV